VVDGFGWCVKTGVGEVWASWSEAWVGVRRRVGASKAPFWLVGSKNRHSLLTLGTCQWGLCKVKGKIASSATDSLTLLE